jgi:hypothetical protein
MPGLVPLGASAAAFSRAGIVDFVEQIQVLVLAEDVADVGHVLWPLRTSGLFFLLGWRMEASTIELIFSGDFFMSGSVISAIKRAHAAGLVLAHHKLHLILARRQIEAGGVLDILLPRLQAGSRFSFTVSRAWPMGRFTSSITEPMMSSVALSLSPPFTNGICEPGTISETGT